MYLSTSTSTQDFSEVYLSTFQVLHKLYLSTDVLKYKVLLPGSGNNTINTAAVPCQKCSKLTKQSLTSAVTLTFVKMVRPAFSVLI